MSTMPKARSFVFAAAILALAAYGPADIADAGTGNVLRDAQRGDRAPPTYQRKAQPAPPAASQTGLPIAPGLFIADYSGSCSAATELLFYDGASVGFIQQALPGNRMNSPRAASIDAHSIKRTGVAARGSKDFAADLAGFTRIWFTDDMISPAGFPVEARGIKLIRDGEFVMREGGMSARGMQYDDTTYRKCAFTQLSAPMQATVRQYRPSLANGAAAASSGAAVTAAPKPPAAAGRIPLAVGYYAYVEGNFSTCAKPVITPWYFDGTRFWEEWDLIDPQHKNTPEALKWEMVGTDRFRITYRNRDENGRWIPSNSVNEYVITGPQSFTFVGTVGAPLRFNEKHQLCSPAQLPPKARWYKKAN
jgi:hypothetical protein